MRGPTHIVKGGFHLWKDPHPHPPSPQDVIFLTWVLAEPQRPITCILNGPSISYWCGSYPRAAYSAPMRQLSWLVAWRHQAITWTNVDLPLVRSCGVHVRTISQEIRILQPSITKISLKITSLKFLFNLLGASELSSVKVNSHLYPVWYWGQWYPWRVDYSQLFWQGWKSCQNDYRGC